MFFLVATLRKVRYYYTRYAVLQSVFIQELQSSPACRLFSGRQHRGAVRIATARDSTRICDAKSANKPSVHSATAVGVCWAEPRCIAPVGRPKEQDDSKYVQQVFVFTSLKPWLEISASASTVELLTVTPKAGNADISLFSPWPKAHHRISSKEAELCLLVLVSCVSLYAFPPGG